MFSAKLHRRLPGDLLWIIWVSERDSLSRRCLWVQLRQWGVPGPQHPPQYLGQGWHSPSWSAYWCGEHALAGRTQRPSPSSL